MVTKAGYINISIELPRSFHAELKEQFKKMPKFWQDLGAVFSAFASYLTLEELMQIKKDHRLAYEFVEEYL